MPIFFRDIDRNDIFFLVDELFSRIFVLFVLASSFSMQSA